ncbi:MAG: TonB family protein [Holosporales bacterium]
MAGLSVTALLPTPGAGHAKALAVSLALHAIVGVWVFFSLTPLRVMPKPPLTIALVPFSAAAIKSATSPIPHAISSKPAVTDIPLPSSKPRKSLPVARTTTPPSAPSVDQHTASTATNNGSAAETATETTPVFDAVYLNNPAPVYPEQARRRGIEGSVLLSVMVAADGTPQSVTVAQSSGFAMLDNAAKEAVARWTFVSAKRGSVAVDARVMVPVDFRLR